MDTQFNLLIVEFLPSLEPAGVENGKQREERFTLEFRSGRREKAFTKDEMALTIAPDPQTSQTHGQVLLGSYQAFQGKI